MSRCGRPPLGKRGRHDELPPTQQEEPVGDSISSSHQHSPGPSPITQEQVTAPPVQPLAGRDADLFIQAMMQTMQMYIWDHQTAASPTQPATQSRVESRPPPPVAPAAPIVPPMQ